MKNVQQFKPVLHKYPQSFCSDLLNLDHRSQNYQFRFGEILPQKIFSSKN